MENGRNFSPVKNLKSIGSLGRNVSIRFSLRDNDSDYEPFAFKECKECSFFGLTGYDSHRYSISLLGQNIN